VTQPPPLFGTDGIRDIAGEGALSPEILLRIGDAIGYVIAEERDGFDCINNGESGREGLRAVLARDTRVSGGPISDVLTERLIAHGIEVLDAGIVPTPACAFLAREYMCNLGIMISASHNPAEYNGIKLFSCLGAKVPEELEKRIEELVGAGVPRSGSPGGATPSMSFGKRMVGDEMRQRYNNHVVDAVRDRLDMSGLKIVLDCANGATAGVAPKIFETLGAEVVAVATESCEDNINVRCGSLHPRFIESKVEEHAAALGCAFDGDGDRVIFADENGRCIDGDFFMAICGRFLHEKGELPGDVVVATVMSNLGLALSLKEIGVSLERTAVGDKYVAERMREIGALLGGEQSGHIILSDRTTTGDGIQTALALVEVMSSKGKSLSELARCMTRYPQVLVNVPVREKVDFNELPDVGEVVREVEERLGETGRIVLRYSGTEPLARVMLEGSDQADIEGYANSIADAIRAAIGAESVKKP
jgi:phosphoglucosamine mutase